MKAGRSALLGLARTGRCDVFVQLFLSAIAVVWLKPLVLIELIEPVTLGFAPVANNPTNC